MAEPLVDSFGRVHRDLRISVTDRCNFRCSYCMPEEGMAWMPRHDLLSYEELERVARLLVERFGVDGIRITGGEPTMRARLPVLVRKLAGLGVDLALTTNGATLRLLADDLASAGLSRINVSLDTLRPERFRELTKRDELDRVLDGIAAALDAGLDPVKVNVVVMRGVNDDELVDLAAFGRARGVEVRFIEFMPLDEQERWRATSVVSRDEILARIGAVFPLAPVAGASEGANEGASEGAAPAERYAYLDGGGTVGVIPSVTHAFCGSCDRIRLTADGKLRNCLFAVEETDLRGPLRDGAGDDELVALVRRCVAEKREGHGIGTVAFLRPGRSMSQIGG